MKLVRVYPIKKGAKLDALSYFTTLDIPIGAVVKVAVRNTQTPAVVIETREVESVKQALRSAPYTVKKISARSFRPLLSPQFIRAIERVSREHIAGVGETLFSAISYPLLKALAESPPPNLTKTYPEKAKETAPEKMILHASPKERVDEYRNLVREAFARKRSVCILCPSIQEVETLREALSKGIEDFVHTFHSSHTPKTLKNAWEKALAEPHAILVIATGAFLFLPRGDIDTYIIEAEQSDAYKSHARPHLDVRILLEYLAEEASARLVRADVPVSLSTWYRFHTNEIDELKPVQSRLLSSARVSAIDMKEEQKTNARKNAFVISEKLKDSIQKTLGNTERVFLFSARRGLSPIILCDDCKEVVRCLVCNAGMVLHRGKQGNVFLCHSCGSMRGAEEKCAHCGSWKLTTLGIGTELVKDTIAELFPEASLFALDRDSVSTHKEARAVSEKFYSTKSAILIGTERALPYLTEAVETTAIVSIDSLLSIPRWDMYEKIFSILTRVRNLAGREMLIQTRNPEQTILTHAMRGMVNEFYKDELAVRERFGYPPFSRIIKLSLSGTASFCEKEMSALEKTLAPFGFSGTTHLIKKDTNRFAVNGFIRIPVNEWPNQELENALRALPPFVDISIDPDGVL